MEQIKRKGEAKKKKTHQNDRQPAKMHKLYIYLERIKLL